MQHLSILAKGQQSQEMEALHQMQMVCKLLIKVLKRTHIMAHLQGMIHDLSKL
jgi:hypothetical protein